MTRSVLDQIESESVPQTAPTSRPPESFYIPSYDVLEQRLVEWAHKHMPEALESICEKWGDVQWEKKCLAAIFRRVCKSDPAQTDSNRKPWIYHVALTVPRELLKLSPFIGRVHVRHDIPGRFGWLGWIKAMEEAEGFSLIKEEKQERKKS